ncbi:MAG: hypothetical protein JRI25_04675 [Deltaproteobacteria bacterium]|nr:hypothetical protein [Deltaproteobacteria bacterium]
MTPTAFIVYLHYTEAHLQSGLKVLAREARRFLPGARIVTAAVANHAQDAPPMALGEDVFRIGGDNRAREFSGYDAGLRWIRETRGPEAHSPVIVANDTFHRTNTLADVCALDADRVAGWLAKGALGGRVDTLPREVHLFGLPLKQYVRTNFVCGRWDVLESLLPTALEFDDEALFSPEEGRFFREDAPMDPRYREYLVSWLLGTPSELFAVWRFSEQHTATNRSHLQGKVKAILCEHHLSARARRQGVPLEPFSPRRFRARALVARVKPPLYAATRLVPGSYGLLTWGVTWLKATQAPLKERGTGGR